MLAEALDLALVAPRRKVGAGAAATGTVVPPVSRVPRRRSELAG